MEADERMHRHVQRLWTQDVGLSILLGVVFFQIFVFYPLVESEITRLFVVHGTFLLIIVSGVMSVLGTPIWGRVVIVLALVNVAFRVIESINHQWWLACSNAIISAIFLALLIGVILVQVFREGPINLHRIAGSVALYMLIGLFFASIYAFLDFLNPSSFNISPNLDSRDPHVVAGDLIYYSFITLTSVVFGDILPVHPIAKTTTMLESMVGQLFPAILLARLVAMEIEASPRRRSKQDREL